MGGRLPHGPELQGLCEPLGQPRACAAVWWARWSPRGPAWAGLVASLGRWLPLNFPLKPRRTDLLLACESRWRQIPGTHCRKQLLLRMPLALELCLQRWRWRSLVCSLPPSLPPSLDFHPQAPSVFGSAAPKAGACPQASPPATQAGAVGEEQPPHRRVLHPHAGLRLPLSQAQQVRP